MDTSSEVSTVRYPVRYLQNGRSHIPEMILLPEQNRPRGVPLLCVHKMGTKKISVAKVGFLAPHNIVETMIRKEKA